MSLEVLAINASIGNSTGVCRIFAPCKAKSSNQALLTDYCVRGHNIIISHLTCQIRNALHFLDFASWCKDSAIPSRLQWINGSMEDLSDGSMEELSDTSSPLSLSRSCSSFEHEEPDLDRSSLTSSA